MGSRSHTAIANLDLIILALALPVFILAGFDLVGYAIAAVVWIVQRLVQVWANRRARQKLAAGDRKGAMGVVAATSLARPWLMALVVLIAGGLIGRDAGLFSAALLVILFTVNFASRGLGHLLSGEPEGEDAS